MLSKATRILGATVWKHCRAGTYCRRKVILPNKFLHQLWKFKFVAHQCVKRFIAAEIRDEKIGRKKKTWVSVGGWRLDGIRSWMSGDIFGQIKANLHQRNSTENGLNSSEHGWMIQSVGANGKWKYFHGMAAFCSLCFVGERFRCDGLAFPKPPRQTFSEDFTKIVCMGWLDRICLLGATAQRMEWDFGAKEFDFGMMVVIFGNVALGGWVCN